MKVVEGCSIPGSYGWKQTTLATDTVEISDADELYAKLPLGAVGLEGQLQRSGRLAIRTTVAGQLQIQNVPATELPKTGACTNVTHFVKSITVGSFRLVSGGAIAGSGSVGVGSVGAGVGSSREESLLREAGDPTRCSEATETAPHAQCASPIQVFLSPVRRTVTGEARVAEMDELRARELGGAFITFPEREGEHWALRYPNGNIICEVPCSRWVPPGSGYYLERTRDYAKVKVSERFGVAPGAHATAEYNPDKGQPFWAALTFYGMGVPLAVGGTIVLILGLTEEEEDSSTGINRSNKGFFFSTAALFLSMSAATALWYFVFTDWESFEVRGNGKAALRTKRTARRPSIEWIPGTLGARF